MNRVGASPGEAQESRLELTASDAARGPDPAEVVVSPRGTPPDSGSAAGAERAGRPSLVSERGKETPVVLVRSGQYVTGRYYAWGRRDDAIAIWRLRPPWTVVESFPLQRRLEAFQRFLELEQDRGSTPHTSSRPDGAEPASASASAPLDVRRRVVPVPSRPAPSLPRARSRLAVGIVALACIGLFAFALRGGSGGLPTPALDPRELGSSLFSPGPTIPARSNQPSGIPSSLPGSSVPGVSVHVDDQAGYLFSYPDSWELSRSGETAELVSPDGDVVMSFGTAPSGPLHAASDRVLEDLTGAYADVELVADNAERTTQGQRAFVVGATATDPNGALVRFLAITIRGLEQNRAITVNFSADSDPLEALPAIREIVASFRVSEAA
jgi:hypothetical protein